MNRFALVVMLLASCKKKEAEKPPAPPPVVVIDAAAAPPAIDAAVAVVIDAPAAKLVLTREGIGSLQRLAWSKKNEEETAKTIQDALSPLMPGIETSFEVMDVPGDVEREEGYWSVKRGDKELVMVLRTSEDGRPAVMMVWTPDIPTEDGIKVGDTVATVLAKHPKLYCFNDPKGLIEQTVAADVTCHDKDAPGILYVLDPKKKKLKKGEIKSATVKDVALVALVNTPK